MSNYPLSPPRFPSLSDNTIGTVLQRNGWASIENRSCTIEDGNFQALFAVQPQSSHRSNNQEYLEAPQPLLDTKSRRTGASKPKRRAHEMNQDENKPSLDDRRERARLNQVRYRKRLQEMPKLLEAQIEKLNLQVQHLTSEHDYLRERGRPQKNIWSVATEYFRIFSCGFPAPTGAGVLDLDFLNAAISSDVDFGAGIGLDALVDNWNTLMQCFPDLRLELKNLKKISEHLIIATTTTSFTVSNAALGNAFPHLPNGSKTGRCSRIAAKMLRQNLVLQGSVRFHWDQSTHRVTGVHTQADLLTPLLELLGNLEDVALVFAYALVSPDCNAVVCG